MFDYNRAEIRSTEMSKIDDIAVYTNQNPSVRVLRYAWWRRQTLIYFSAASPTRSTEL
jgi:hypothetical protein